MAHLPRPDQRTLERASLGGYAREELDEVESGLRPMSLRELAARLAQLQVELAGEPNFAA